MKGNTFRVLNYALLGYLVVTVPIPMVMLFLQIRGENIQSVVILVQFFTMLKNSILTTLIATIISVVLAFFLAFVIVRSRVRFKSVWMVIFTIPMLILSISHGMGLVLLLGDNGLLTNMLSLNFNLYGIRELLWGLCFTPFQWYF